MDSRGIIGGMMVTFVATILIFLILLVFVIGSSFVKEFDGVADGLRVYDEGDVGISDIGSYMLNYSMIVSVRYYVFEGKSIGEAIVEAGYDK